MRDPRLIFVKRRPCLLDKDGECIEIGTHLRRKAKRHQSAVIVEGPAMDRHAAGGAHFVLQFPDGHEVKVGVAQVGSDRLWKPEW